MYVKDSRELALEWEAANRTRALELNDALDACLTLKDKRDLYASLSEEEKDGMMLERMRRQRNREAPTGSLVSGFIREPFRGFEFSTNLDNGGVMSGCHLGIALVIGHGGHGDAKRYLMLLPPWKNKEGTVVRFAEAYSFALEVINE